MNRRDLFRTMLGAGVVATSGTPKPRPPYGRLTVESHHAHKKITGEDLHVWIDGQDVTARCFEADDVAGYVLIYCHDQAEHSDWTARGATHIGEHGRACTMKVTGRVVIGLSMQPPLLREDQI